LPKASEQYPNLRSFPTYRAKAAPRRQHASVNGSAFVKGQLFLKR
jgi:hypothetical protein